MLVYLALSATSSTEIQLDDPIHYIFGVVLVPENISRRQVEKSHTSPPSTPEIDVTARK